MKALTDDISRTEVKKKTTIDKEVMMCVFDLDIVTLLIMYELAMDDDLIFDCNAIDLMENNNEQCYRWFSSSPSCAQKFRRRSFLSLCSFVKKLLEQETGGGIKNRKTNKLSV